MRLELGYTVITHPYKGSRLRAVSVSRIESRATHGTRAPVVAAPSANTHAEGYNLKPVPISRAPARVLRPERPLCAAGVSLLPR